MVGLSTGEEDGGGDISWLVEEGAITVSGVDSSGRGVDGKGVEGTGQGREVVVVGER